MGNTSKEINHSLASLKELNKIFDFFKMHLDLDFPQRELGNVKVGTREKAQKRAPYMFTKGRVSFLGGLYKNGYILSLKLTKNFIHQFLGSH